MAQLRLDKSLQLEDDFEAPEVGDIRSNAVSAVDNIYLFVKASNGVLSLNTGGGGGFEAPASCRERTRILYDKLRSLAEKKKKRECLVHHRPALARGLLSGPRG